MSSQSAAATTARFKCQLDRGLMTVAAGVESVFCFVVLLSQCSAFVVPAENMRSFRDKSPKLPAARERSTVLARTRKSAGQHQ